MSLYVENTLFYLIKINKYILYLIFHCILPSLGICDSRRTKLFFPLKIHCLVVACVFFKEKDLGYKLTTSNKLLLIQLDVKKIRTIDR